MRRQKGLRAGYKDGGAAKKTDFSFGENLNLAPYGLRHWTPRHASSPFSPKGQGFYGPMVNSQGRAQTEYSIGMETPQGLVEVPTIYSGVPLDEIKRIRNDEVTPQIARNARRAARQRLQEGKPPFADTDDERIRQVLFYKARQ